MWEYSEENANEKFRNTIEQLSLIELYPDSGLYSYGNWYECDKMIDVFWIEGNYSFIANIPVALLKTDVDFVRDFCSSKKVNIN